jgi:hypothetical protein
MILSLSKFGQFGVVFFGGILVCGCSRTAEVRGTVYLNGTPLPSGRITFYSMTQLGRSCTGDIQPDGGFHLPACPTGTAKVTIQPQFLNGFRKGRKLTPVQQPRRNQLLLIPQRYLNPETTDILVTIYTGTNYIDIHMQP